MIAGLAHFRKDVARDEHGLALAAQTAKKLADLLDAGRVETVGRFVEDQEFWILEQSCRYPQPLLHT